MTAVVELYRMRPNMTIDRPAQPDVVRRWSAFRRTFGSQLLRPALVSRTQILLATKTSVAAGLAWAVALVVDPHSRPYFAPLAVILIVQPTVYDSLSRAFQRVIGVVVGVAAALAVNHFVSLSGWSIAIIVFVGLLVGWSAVSGPRASCRSPSALCSSSRWAAPRPATGQTGARHADRFRRRGRGCARQPPAPRPNGWSLNADAPLRRCRDIVMEIGSGVSSDWTLEQAEGLAEPGVRSGGGHSQRQAGPSGASTHGPMERTSPSTTPGTRTGGPGARCRRTDCHPGPVHRPGAGGRGGTRSSDAGHRHNAGLHGFCH